MRSTLLLVTGLTGLLALGCATIAPDPATAGWKHFRGPNQDGAVSAVESTLAPFHGLELAWRIPLGAGYSGIVAAQDKVVTMFTDGEDDVIAAFDTASGEEIWRHRLDAYFPGRDGSTDGPLSSPTIFEQSVFALAPRGMLYAFNLEDGSVQWSRDLPADFGARMPDYGFTTTPLVEDRVLIVQTGGDQNQSIIGLDPATGETKWNQGDGGVEYQSPIAIDLAEQRQVVTVSGEALSAIEAKSGRVLWRRPFGEKEWSDTTTVAPAGPDRFVAYAGGDAITYQVAKSEGAFAVDEIHRHKYLGETYALPVFADGFLYGFRGNILSAVNASTGELAWRSRSGRGNGILRIGDQLAVYGADGEIFLVTASPDGFQEDAQLQALDEGGLSFPAYANGMVFVRNLKEMAAVQLTGPTPSTTATPSK